MTAHKTTGNFPLDSFREAATHLRRPFTPEAVKFKVQATWPKEKPSHGLIVAYIDARLAVERLNLILPDRWSDHYEPIGGGLMWCHLTVDGVTRSDVGEGQGKALVSDALKRAAVKFGVGVSLYAIPKMRVSVEAGQARAKGSTLEMTANGEQHVRSIYRLWLEGHGNQAFGTALDHGDVEQAQGDFEDTEPHRGTAARSPSSNEPPAGVLVGAEQVKTLQEAARGLMTEQIKAAMVSCGIKPPDPFVPQTAFIRIPREKADLLAQALTESHDVVAPEIS